MSDPKFKIGEIIKVKDQYGDWVEGHVVLIMNSRSDDREYYCSMYPGSLPNYYWINCADLTEVVIDGKINTLQALNKFKESELEFVSSKKVRKYKLKQIKKSEN